LKAGAMGEVQTEATLQAESQTESELKRQEPQVLVYHYKLNQ